MRILILAAGEATRWGDHLGLPKHLVPLRGEPILHRSVRLIRKLRPDADIRIVVRDLADPRYHVPGALVEQAHLREQNGDADKFLSSMHLWHPEDRTVLLYGDCYLTTPSMERIVSGRGHEDGWHVVARFGASTWTGTEWGENFAHVIDPVAQARYRDCLFELAARRRREDIWRAGGWEQYALMARGDLTEPGRNIGFATHVDDWSDDFDYPADYDRWCRLYAAADAAVQDLAE